MYSEIESIGKPLAFSWQLWVMMAISLSLAVPLAYLLNIRFDEAFTLETTTRGPIDAFRQAVGFGQQAPLYFVLISIWRSLDSSIVFARLFSVLCFPLIIWVAAEVSRRYVKEVNPLWTALIVLVHQQVIWNALDIRLYALMTLLSGVLLMLFYDGYLNSSSQTRVSRVLFIIAAVASLYTQYYLGFMLVGGLAALLLSGKIKQAAIYTGDMALAGLAFLPMLVILINGQMATVSGHDPTAVPITELIDLVYQRSISFMLAVNAIEPGPLKRWLARGAVAVIAALFAIRLFRRRDAADIALVSFAAVAAAFYMLAIYLVGEQLNMPRHLSLLILPVTLISLAAILYVRSRIALHAWLALVVGLSLLHMLNSYTPLAKPGDFERTAKYITANAASDEPILIFHADAILPFRYYFKAPNKLIVLPQENGTTAWDPRNNVLKSEASILDRINAEAPNARQFWLMHDGWCAHGTIKFNCEMLESVIDKNFTVVSEKAFLPPTTVRLLRRKATSLEILPGTD